MRILGIQLANGYSSEARVFASLLGARPSQCDQILVLHHDWQGDRTSANAFERDAHVSLERVDSGWRPSSPHRRLPSKVKAHLRFRTTLPRMRAIARDFQPDIVVSSQQKWDCAAATSVAKHLGLPQLIHLHYNIGPWLGAAVVRRLQSCQHVVTVSDFIRRQVLDLGVPTERVTTIHNSMVAPDVSMPVARQQTRAQLAIRDDARLISFVARLDPGKGHHESLQAFDRIADRHPDAHLLIVGDGAIRAELEAEALALSSAKRISFAGHRRDIADVLMASDIFLHPSHADPFPLAVLEASAAGLPVVALADGGIPEMVANGETGLLSPPHDIDHLAESLARLLDNPDCRRRFGAAGRARIQREFRPEKAARAYFDVVRRTLFCGHSDLIGGHLCGA